MIRKGGRYVIDKPGGTPKRVEAPKGAPPPKPSPVEGEGVKAKGRPKADR